MNSHTYNDSDLRVSIPALLRRLGYELQGDEESGFNWSIGTGGAQSTLAWSTIDEAITDAVADLVDRTDELRAGAQGVLDNWEHGDLAGVVRELHTCVAAMASCSDSAETLQPGSFQVCEGYLTHEGVRIEVQFQIPESASTTDKDLAFFAALAQKAEIDYVVLGRTSSDRLDAETPDSSDVGEEGTCASAQALGLNEEQISYMDRTMYWVLDLHAIALDEDGTRFQPCDRFDHSVPVVADATLEVRLAVVWLTARGFARIQEELVDHLLSEVVVIDKGPDAEADADETFPVPGARPRSPQIVLA